MGYPAFSKYFVLDLDEKTIPAEGLLKHVRPVAEELAAAGKNVAVVDGSRAYIKHWRGPASLEKPKKKRAKSKSSSAEAV